MSALLEIADLAIAYGDKPAVKGVSLRLGSGEIVGLVGESGSGKSTVALAVMGLLPPGCHITSGTLQLGGQNLRHLPPAEWRALLGRRIAYVPQEPMTALNPVLTVGRQIDLVLAHHGRGDRSARRRLAEDSLTAMGLADPARILASLPSRLSGGQLQRVLLAQAFALEPDLLIADEPTTALDVTVQAEVLALLTDAAARRGTAVLFISHNIAVVWQLTQRIAVMRHGEIVETGATRSVIANPATPYTRQLMAALPALCAPRTHLPVPA
ncbi:ABC transporter ATP-binding protein [Novosphingobium sp.]|uniref:ABC transporter ATP-binding protein n=1 Tax=Novosphingobium sp. TaxID=1874826 RepID=UPI00262E8920|nr:ABC transporter ATP-binding protein [Novosphingobium sp.]